MTAKQIKERFKSLQAARTKTEAWWTDVATNLMPELITLRESSFFQGKSRASSGQPALAFKAWRDGLQGYFVSKKTPWFRLRQQERWLNEIPEVRQYHQDSEEQMYDALDSAGFYGSSLEGFMTDAGALGSGCQYVITDPVTHSLRFINESIENVWIDIDQYDNIDTVYRKFKMSAKAAQQRFETLSPAMTIAAKSKPQQQFEFIHAVEPNTSIVRSAADWTGKKYTSTYLDVANSYICETSGYSHFPAVVWRPKHIKGSAYGTGPAFDCLTDIKIKQKSGRDNMEAVHLNMYPALQVPSSLRGRERLHPKGITYYDDPTQLIKPINQGVNSTIDEKFAEEINRTIDQFFLVDLFYALNRSDSAKTATEILERQGEKAAMMMPIMNTMGTDFLDPIISSTYQTEHEAGRMPKVPDILMDMGYVAMKIEYIGPLAQAQKKYFHTQSIKSSLNDISQVMQIDPSVADNIDLDFTARELLLANAMPQKAIRSPEEVAEIRQARQAAAQQAEQVENLGAIASAAGNMNKKIEPDSPLDAIAQQIGGA